MSDPRAHQAKRERFRKAVLAMYGPVCRMPRCLMDSRAIDLRLEYPAGGSYSADHHPRMATLLRLGLDPYDPRNGRPAHLTCNTADGARFSNKRRKGKPKARPQPSGRSTSATSRTPTRRDAPRLTPPHVATPLVETRVTDLTWPTELTRPFNRSDDW